MWHLPSGKLDAGEDIFTAAAREAEEEVGVLINPADLEHVHSIHVAGSGPEARIGHFFATTRWIGEPHQPGTREVSRTGLVRLPQLPANIIEYPAAGIDAYRRGVRGMSLMGWHESRPASVGA
jgi:8-oxo-dGTP diphosphatase